MVDKARSGLLNAYRSEIMAKCPKSLAIWQGNRSGDAGGRGQHLPAGGPVPNGG